MSAERPGKLAVLAVAGGVGFSSALVAESSEGIGGDVVVAVSLVLRLWPRLDPVAAAHLSRSGLE